MAARPSIFLYFLVCCFIFNDFHLKYLIFECLDLYFACLDLYFVFCTYTLTVWTYIFVFLTCILGFGLVFGCLYLYFGCLNLYFRCPGLVGSGRAAGSGGRVGCVQHLGKNVFWESVSEKE